MATIKYLIKGKNNPTTIYLRFRHGRKYDFTKSTLLLINPNHWNIKKGNIKFNINVSLQNTLNLLSSHILNDFNNSYSSGYIIDKNWLDESIKDFINSNERVVSNLIESAKEIIHIETIFNLKLKEFKPYKPAIYFLIQDSVVVYIGQTKSLPSRINYHLQQQVKNFDKIMYVNVSIEKLDELECQFIKYFNPRYNISNN